MLKALQLVFEPAPTWEVIGREERGVAWVFLLSLLPAALTAAGLEGMGLHLWGNQPTSMSFTSRQTIGVAPDAIVRYEAVQVVITVVTVFLLAFLFRMVVRSFHSKSTFAQSFRLMSYSFGPVLLLQAVDGIPMAPTWGCRIVGAALGVKVLYLGLGRIVRPDPASALGLYFVGALMLLIFNGMGHFFALRVLEAGLLDQWTLPTL